MRPVARKDQGEQRRAGVAAAATRINLTERREAAKYVAKAQPWHGDAWDAFDEVPEIGESLMYRADQLAKLRLFPAVADPDNPEGNPIPVGDERAQVPEQVQAAAAAEVARLRSAMGGQAEIIRRFSLNMDVAGDCYLVGYEPTAGAVAGAIESMERWQVHSTDEVKVDDATGDVTILPKPGSSEGVQLGAGDFLARIWTPHPRWALLPWSPLYHLRTDSRVVITLNQQVISESLSTQPAGILLVPNEIEFKWPKGMAPPDDDPSADPFMAILEAAIEAAIAAFGDAASQFPLVVRGAAEFLKPEVFRHISMARTPDTTTEDRIRARVERIARGLPLPVEKIMGHQQTTYANAAQVDVDEFTDYLQPSADTLVQTFGFVFLTPHLHDNAVVGAEWADRIVLWYDPAALIAEPDPADSADKGAELGYIGGAAWRRVKGWSEEDAPEPLEVLARMAWNRGSLDPALTAQLLGEAAAAAGIELTPAEAQAMTDANPQQAAALAVIWQAARARGEPPSGIRPRPARGTAGAIIVSPPAITAAARRLPVADAGARLVAIDRDLRARLVAAADSAMARALERAGNHLRNVARKHGVTAALRCPPEHVAGLLGRGIVAAATDVDLTDPKVWAQFQQQFMRWGDNAQGEALDLAGRIAGGFSDAERRTIGLRQADDLTTAWSWLERQMGNLATAMLYDPTGVPQPLGEFDPNSKVPTGMLRQALAIAGGSPLQLQSADAAQGSYMGEAWTSVGDRLPGGIGAGERILGALHDGGVEVHAYRWVYGPALRGRPFPPHLELDGVVFESFSDSQLAVQGGFPPRAYYLPGDHVGCVCDVEPQLRPMAGAAPESPPLAPRTPAPNAEALDQLAARYAAGTWYDAHDRLADGLVGRLAPAGSSDEKFLRAALQAGNAEPDASLGYFTTDPSKFLHATSGIGDRDLILAERVDPSAVAARARQSLNWAKSTEDDPVVIVNLITNRDTGEGVQVVVRGTERLLASHEQGVHRGGTAVRIYRQDLFADELGLDPADVRRFTDAEHQAAMATRPDIAAETQAGIAARREALGPIPQGLNAKQTTAAFLERWGDRGVGKPQLHADFSYMPPEVAYEVADQLDILMRAHPEVAETISSTGSPSFVKGHLPGNVRLRGQGANTWADATDIGTLRWNPSYFSRTGAAMKRGQGMLRADGTLLPHQLFEDSKGLTFHPRLGTTEVSNARTVVTHEFGHLIRFLANRNASGGSLQVGNLQRAIIDKYAAGRPQFTAVKEEISKYAVEGKSPTDETSAEATLVGLISSSPSPMAREIYEMIRDLAAGRAPTP